LMDSQYKVAADPASLETMVVVENGYWAYLRIQCYTATATKFKPSPQYIIESLTTNAARKTFLLTR